jgi:hypothetical protein
MGFADEADRLFAVADPRSCAQMHLAFCLPSPRSSGRIVAPLVHTTHLSKCRLQLIPMLSQT